MTDHTRPQWGDLPHGGAIGELLDALRDLTDAEVTAMDTMWSVSRGATWEDAMNAAWDAAGARCAASDAARVAVRVAVGDAAGRAAASRAARYAVRVAVGDAVLALVVADLVGQYGLTREHLDILTGSARAVPRLAKIIDRALPGGES